MGKMSSKKASQIKNLGHAEEMTFNALFGDKGHREINHSGASNDNVITNPKYRTEISNHLGTFHDYTVSLKSGKTWQFHLGQINQHTKGTTGITSISIDGIRKFKIPNLILSEQKKFTKKLDIINSLIIEFESKIQYSQSLQKSLINQIF